MKQSEILMVRNMASYEGEVFPPRVPFLKKAISREEVDNGFWLVHDMEQSYWYVVDRDSGLVVTRAETRAKAKKNFDFLRDRAFQARSGKGYEEAKKRLLRLQDRPIWDPKKESDEEFAKRLAKWGNGYMEEYE